MAIQTETSQTTAALNANAQQLLFAGRNLDFQSTLDQALTKQFTGTSYVVRSVFAVRKSGATSVACLGGIYTATSKGGSALVAAAQSWLGLSGALKLVDATLAAIAGTDLQSAAPLYLSLSTGSTGVCTADVFVYGCILD